MELIDAIHQVISQTMDASAMTDLSIGTVIKASPLEISINPQMAALKAPALSLTWAVVPHFVDLPPITLPGGETASAGKIQITRGLQAGDKVLMLRVQKGQKFIVLSRIEEG